MQETGITFTARAFFYYGTCLECVWKWKTVPGPTEDKMPLFFGVLHADYTWKILLKSEAR